MSSGIIFALCSWQQSPPATCWTSYLPTDCPLPLHLSVLHWIILLQWSRSISICGGWRACAFLCVITCIFLLLPPGMCVIAFGWTLVMCRCRRQYKLFEVPHIPPCPHPPPPPPAPPCHTHTSCNFCTLGAKRSAYTLLWRAVSG